LEARRTQQLRPHNTAPAGSVRDDFEPARGHKEGFSHLLEDLTEEAPAGVKQFAKGVLSLGYPLYKGIQYFSKTPKADKRGDTAYTKENVDRVLADPKSSEGTFPTKRKERPGDFTHLGKPKSILKAAEKELKQEEKSAAMPTRKSKKGKSRKGNKSRKGKGRAGGKRRPTKKGTMKRRRNKGGKRVKNVIATSFATGSLGQSRFKMHTSGGDTMRVTGHARLGAFSVSASNTTGQEIFIGTRNFALEINPRLLGITRLNAVSPLYERYKFNSFSVHFLPSGGSTDKGSIVCYHEMDPDDDLAGGAQVRVNNAYDHERGHGWNFSSVDKPPSWGIVSSKNGSMKYYVDAGAEDRLVIQSTFHIIIDVAPGQNTAGTWWISYDCTLFQPKSDADSFGGGGFWGVSGTNGCSNGKLIGISPIIDTVSTLPFTIETTGSTITIPAGAVDVGQGIQISLAVQGNTLVGSLVVPTTTNLTFDAAYSSGTNLDVNVDSTGAEANGCYVYYVTDPSLPATFRQLLTSAASISYGGYSISVYSRSLGRKTAMTQIEKKMKELRRLMSQATRLGMEETPGVSDLRGLVPPDEKGDHKSTVDYNTQLFKDRFEQGELSYLKNSGVRALPTVAAPWFDREGKEPEPQNESKDLMKSMIEAKRAQIANATQARLARPDLPTPSQGKEGDDMDVQSVSSGPDREEEFGALHTKLQEQAALLDSLKARIDATERFAQFPPK
jgi:hypothetical protein